MKKRIISIIISGFITLSLFPGLSVYADGTNPTEDVTCEVIYPSDDAYYKQGAYNKNDVIVWRNTSGGGFATSSYYSHGFFKYDIGSVRDILASDSNLVVKSVKFMPYAKTAASGDAFGSARDVKKLQFWNVYSNWNDEELATLAVSDTNILGRAASGAKIADAPDLELASAHHGGQLSNTKNTYGKEVYDITALYFKHEADANITDKSTFSFYLSYDAGVKDGPMYTIVSNEGAANGTYISSDADDTVKAAGIEFVYGLKDEITSITETLPQVPGDEMEIGFSNIIQSATVTVDGNAFDSAVINGKILSIPYPWQAFSSYSVTIEATDIYGQSFSKTYNFAVGHFTSSSTTPAAATYIIDDNGAKTAGSSDTGKQSMTGGARQAILAKIPINAIGEGKILESAVHQAHFGYAYSTDGHNFYAYEGAVDSITSLKYNDIEAYLTDKYFIDSPRLTNAEGKISTFKEKTATVDITSMVNKAMKNGEEYVYVLYTTVNSCVYASVNQYGSTSSARPTITLVVNPEPSINFINCKKTIKGHTLKEFSFNLTTDADDILSYVCLTDLNGNMVDTASFEYDPYTRKVSLASPALLNESTAYRVVIKSGLADDFGNVLSSDLAVSEFYIGKDIEISPVSLINADITVDGVPYDDIAKTETLKNGDSLKAMVHITNNTEDTYAAVLIIASYEGNLLSEVNITNIDAGVSGHIYTSDMAVSVDLDVSKVQAFLWKSTDKPAPLADGASLEK